MIQSIQNAAAMYVKRDGTYRRDGLRRIATQYGVSERTVRRAVAALDAPPVAVSIDVAPETIDAARKASEEGCSSQSILLSLTVGAGNMKVAHEFAAHRLGYGKTYRSFIRDVERLDPALVAAARHGYKGLVENRLYLSNPIPHRNHTWFVDHTKADVWVLPDRGNTPFRPWLTVIVDGATNTYMALEAWDGHINTERFTSTLTRAAVGDAYEGADDVTVGGLPNVLVCDNAKEHLAHAVEEGAVRLGIIVSPTTPYHSWENGRVETAHASIARSFLATLPGYSKGGVRPDGTPRFAPPGQRAGTAPDPDRRPTGLLKMSEFQALLEEFRQNRNATVKDRRGLTPLDKWENDKTPLRHITYNLMLAHLTTTAELRTVHKEGIRFRNGNYMCAALAPYRKRKVTVRYLATVTDWIEVFDGDEYVGRAWLTDHLSETERSRILLQRARTEKQYRLVEQKARQHRTHFARAVAEGWDADSLPHAPTLTAGFTGEENTGDALPILNSPGRHPHGPASQSPARNNLADRLLNEDFRLEGDAS